MATALRTSEEHPLVVDWLPEALTGHGRLGLTVALGAQGWRRGARAWWERDAELDLGRLVQVYRAEILVCVVDAEEADRLAAGGIRELAETCGLELHRLTARAGAIPRDAEATGDLATYLAQALRAGRNVVVHGIAEVGRAETLAATLLCALGKHPHAALAAVQRLRQPALPVQPAQLAFVAALAQRWQAKSEPISLEHLPMTVYYHRNCPDGATAAWVAQKACEARGRPVQLVPLKPGEMEGLSMALGAQVLMLDVCVPGPQLDELYAAAADVTVLDHHKTSAPYAVGRPWVHIIPDACGAMLAWRHFHGDAEPPKILRYVQDMDLWRNELPRTAEVQRLLRTMLRPEQVAAVAHALDHDFEATVTRGAATLEVDRATLGVYLKQTTPARIGETTVHAVCIQQRHAGLGSDIANAIAEKFGGIAVAWRCEAGSYRYSLRSVPSSGPDVTLVAQQYGGGGHTHAAGCKAARQILQFADKP